MLLDHLLEVSTTSFACFSSELYCGPCKQCGINHNTHEAITELSLVGNYNWEWCDVLDLLEEISSWTYKKELHLADMFWLSCAFDASELIVPLEFDHSPEFDAISSSVLYRITLECQLETALFYPAYSSFLSFTISERFRSWREWCRHRFKQFSYFSSFVISGVLF